MTSPQPLLAWLLVGCTAVSTLLAQESSSGASGGTSGTSGAGASSAFGSPAPATGGAAPAAPSSPFNPAAPGSTGTGAGTAETPGATGGTGATGAASSFGTGGVQAPPAEAPATFSVSTGYGRAPQIFVSGEGRLARPRFETKFSSSIGFDDNIFQTPTDAEGVPDQVVLVQTAPAVEQQVILEPIPQRRQPARLGPIAPAPQEQQFREVIIPAQEAQFEELVIPGTPPPDRQASLINRGTLAFEAQLASRRQLFTFDLNVNADYYWSRPGKKEDYNGSLSLIYLRRLAPRLQFTASVNAAYRSEPDLGQINTPTNSQQGSYLTFNSKADLSYRWTPRLSTVASVSFNSLTYQEAAAQTGDYNQLTTGLELRYLWTPRLTGVVEGRYSQFRYKNNPSLDSNTIFALLGLDVTVTRRATGTIRLGVASRKFIEGDGDNKIAPYAETTLLYQLRRATVVSWNGRFGFEEPPDANSEVLSLRSGVTVSHSFSPRLRASLAFNTIYQLTTNDIGLEDQSQLTFDSTFSLDYTLTRNWSFNGYYTYTSVFNDPNDASNYFRNRIFMGFEYEF